jgi:hypothetical protein
MVHKLAVLIVACIISANKVTVNLKISCFGMNGLHFVRTRRPHKADADAARTASHTDCGCFCFPHINIATQIRTSF